MARKRVWLFIVEGETDKTSLGLSLESGLRNNTVAFDVFRSDIFGMVDQHRAGSDPVMRIRSARERIRKEVLDHIDKADYIWNDLDKVVLILDTDGTFVPNEKVVENDSLSHISYCLDHIETPNANRIRKRNEERATNIRGVLGKANVTFKGRSVPVDVYFFSRNLEHSLHDRPEELTERTKARLAREFRSRYKNDFTGFVNLLENEIAVPGDYRGTWAYIQDGTHSLERGSNLHLLLQQTSTCG